MRIEVIVRKAPHDAGIGATESVPEVVYLMGLLADECCGARRGLALLHTFAKLLLLRRQGHSDHPAGLGSFTGSTA